MGRAWERRDEVGLVRRVCSFDLVRILPLPRPPRPSHPPQHLAYPAMSSTRLVGHPSLPAPVVHAGFSAHQSKSHVLAGVQDAYWSDDDAVSHSQTLVRSVRNHLGSPDHRRMMPNVPFVSRRWIFQTSISSHVSAVTRHESLRNLYETCVVTSSPDLPLLLASYQAEP